MPTLEGVDLEDLIDDIEEIIEDDPDCTECNILDELTDRWDISYEAATEALQAYNNRDEEDEDYYDEEED